MDVDFDDAAAAWRANKRQKGQLFFYICGFVHPNGRRCGRDAAKGTALGLRNMLASGELALCRQHLMLEENRLRAILEATKKLRLAAAGLGEQSSYNTSEK